MSEKTNLVALFEAVQKLWRWNHFGAG